MNTAVKHRIYTDHNYKGIQVYALPGLHEYATELAGAHFTKSLPVLELGAGSGALSLRMHDHGYIMHPVDLDGDDWHLDMTLVEADMNQPNWRARLQQSTYQQIVCLEVIEHLENPAKFFRDIAEILAPGGKLILSTPNIFNVHSVHAAFKRGELALFSPTDCIESGHISILPWWMLSHFAKRNELNVLHCQGVCDIPTGGIRHIMVETLRWIRRRIFKPADFKNIEGLNVVMVFQKP